MIQLDVRVIRRQTARAFQVVLRNYWIIWIPTSQVGNSEAFKAGDRDIRLEVPEWLAEMKARDYDWGEIVPECIDSTVAG